MFTVFNILNNLYTLHIHAKNVFNHKHTFYNVSSLGVEPSPPVCLLFDFQIPDLQIYFPEFIIYQCKGLKLYVIYRGMIDLSC